MMQSRMHPIPAVAIGALLLAAVAGCGGLLPTPDPTDPGPRGAASLDDGFGSTIDVSNGTTLAIAIVVNGAVVAHFPPQGGGSIDPGLLPPLPWEVEARTVSGRRLVGFAVQPGQVTRRTLPDGTTEMVGAGGRADLSCGRLDVTVGPPMIGPAPGAGRPGDCAP